jgi:DNA-binding response OmpR family regulator
MNEHLKVLILEDDDFLRELLGNLLHKNNCYIMNGSTIERGINEVALRKVDKIILGTSCKDFDGKATIHFLIKKFPEVEIFLINNGDHHVTYLPNSQQMLVSNLSIQGIIDRIITEE